VPAILALTSWLLGEVVREHELMEVAIARAVESAHEPTVANTYFLKALFEMLRGDAAAAQSAADTVVELARKLKLPVMVVEGALCSAGARARLGGSAGRQKFDGSSRHSQTKETGFTCHSSRADSPSSKPNEKV
jgi:hypothetical protein